MAKLSDYVKDQREYNADQDRSRERKIESCIFPAIENVPRQTANGQVGTPKQQKKSSQQEQHETKEYEEFAEIKHRLRV